MERKAEGMIAPMNPQPAERDDAPVTPVQQVVVSIRKLLDQVAFWQAMGFVALAALIWAINIHDLAREFSPGRTEEECDLLGTWIITAAVFAIGAIAVANTYLQQKRILSGLICVCSYCKKVRVQGTHWKQMEEYVSARTLAEFTHGVCPVCMKRIVEECDAEEALQASAPKGPPPA